MYRKSKRVVRIKRRKLHPPPPYPSWPPTQRFHPVHDDVDGELEEIALHMVLERSWDMRKLGEMP